MSRGALTCVCCVRRCIAFEELEFIDQIPKSASGKILRLNQATPAALLTKDGNVNPPTLDIRNDSGEATIEMTRVTGSPGVSGSGPLMQFTFVAVGKGSTNVTVTDVNLRNSKQEAISATVPPAVVPPAVINVQ